ncbi:MAG: GNAT family N-acetyltransferase [Rhodoglobus sp.]
MKPVNITTPRLVLDQPGLADVDQIAQYCRDPLFETYLTTPWPYRLADAQFFVGNKVPEGWRTGSEYIWALRAKGQFLGMIGYVANLSTIGFWIGQPHRGNGYMTEALAAVADWVFAAGNASLAWECVIGNMASVSVARKAGFTFRGEGPGKMPDRDGLPVMCWHAELLSTDSRDPKPGWPTP